MIDSIISRAQTRVDKTTATLLVSSDPEVKRFISEALFIGALLFLIQKYCAGLLKGLGFDALAEAHGKQAATFLKKLKAGGVTDVDIKEAKEQAAQSVQAVRGQALTETAESQAASSVEAELLEAGALPAQARDVTVTLSLIILQS